MDAQAVQAMVDRQAITDVIHRYSRSMDRVDRELGYSLFHGEGEADYGSMFKGTGRGWIDHACARHLESCLAHSHQITSITIALDGDSAGSEAYVTAVLRRQEDGRLVQRSVQGRYIDTWARRDGRWAILKRVYVHDFDELREVNSALEGWGARDRSDPSYAVLESAGRG
jgi:hypothetical protein